MMLSGWCFLSPNVAPGHGRDETTRHVYTYQLHPGGTWRIFDRRKQPVPVPRFLDQTGNAAVKFKESSGKMRAIIRVGRNEGMVDADGHLLIPPVYRRLELEQYCAEVGWIKGSEVLDGFIGYVDASGLMGLLDERGVVVTPARFEGIFFDGYFFSGHVNPRPGMEACRMQARESRHTIFAFARSGDHAIGYFDLKGAYHPLWTENP